MIDTIEDIFSHNEYNGLDVLPFRIVSGIGNTIISAPHSVRQKREGLVKLADAHTGKIAIQLMLTTGSHLILKTSNKDDDANYDINCKYKKDLLDYIANNNIKYLIDLHGMKNSYDIDIDICVNDYKNVHQDKELVKDIQNIFLNTYKIVTVDKLFSANSTGVVSKYISENSGIKALQFELSKSTREDSYIVKVLADIISYLVARN